MKNKKKHSKTLSIQCSNSSIQGLKQAANAASLIYQNKINGNANGKKEEIITAWR